MICKYLDVAYLDVIWYVLVSHNGWTDHENHCTIVMAFILLTPKLTVF